MDHAGSCSLFSPDLTSSTEISTTKNPVCKCPLSGCPYISNRQSNITRHIRSMHKVREVPDVCCGATFFEKQAYRNHQSTVHAQGYLCPEDDCGKRFKAKTHFVLHLGTHQNRSKFNMYCQYNCGYNTSRKGNLRRHEENHSKKTITSPSMPSAAGMYDNIGSVAPGLIYSPASAELFTQYSTDSSQYSVLSNASGGSFAFANENAVELTLLADTAIRREQSGMTTAGKKGGAFCFGDGQANMDVSDSSTSASTSFAAIVPDVLESDSNAASVYSQSSNIQNIPMAFPCKQCKKSFSMLKFMLNHACTLSASNEQSGI